MDLGRCVNVFWIVCCNAGERVGFDEEDLNEQGTQAGSQQLVWGDMIIGCIKSRGIPCRSHDSVAFVRCS